MDVENGKIDSIGEVQETKKGLKLLNLVVWMPLGEKKTFVVYENSVPSFDLVRKFQRGVFKPGQMIGFNFNKAREDWQFDTIWKINIRRDIDERREQDPAPAAEQRDTKATGEEGSKTSSV